MVEYKFSTVNALNLLKLPRYIKLALSLHGKFASIIIEQLCLHGSVEMSILVLKVLAKFLNENYDQKQEILNDPTKLNSYYNQIKEAFSQLVNDKLIQRLPDLAEPVDFLHSEQNGNSKTNGNDTMKNSKLRQADKVPKFQFNNDFSKFSLPEIKIDGWISIFFENGLNFI